MKEQEQLRTQVGESMSGTTERTKTLAETLDEDIDKFMENLPRRPYKDGWAEDKWQEEMEKHPFFMTKPLNENEELPPLIEGLQQLKYDENENTPDELANTFKNDGNFSFKCKKYRDAITNYSAGLKCDCSKELKASLYNNRAAANFFLQNYRSALSDSENAVKLNPDYVKAKVRIAQCYYFLKKFEECIEMCDKIISLQSDGAIVELKKKALNDQKVQDRDSRKQHKNQQKLLSEEKQLLDVIVRRNIKCLPVSRDADSVQAKKVTNISELQPSYGNLPLKRVYLDGGDLVWSVVFLYPVYNIFDCIQEFRDDHKFEDHLNEMLCETPDWDIDKKYKSSTVNIYFQDENAIKFKVSLNETLKQVLQHERFVISNGVPLFFILPKNSEEETEFLMK